MDEPSRPADLDASVRGPRYRRRLPDEPKSKYEIWQVLGWPYETSVAMARMVFSGLLREAAEAAHHHAPLRRHDPVLRRPRRDALGAARLAARADGSEADVLKRLPKPPIEYFKMFYGDTVLGGSAAALRCGLDFFGVDHVVFASDCPFDPEGGPMFIREGIRSIEELDVSETVKRRIYETNAEQLLTPLKEE